MFEADHHDRMVHFIIGEVHHSLMLSDIQAHKNCYFASVIKDEWNNSDQPIVIDRDGVLFQHISAYIYNCRYKLPFAIQGSLSELVGVRREADYYNFPELVVLCDLAYDHKLTSWCNNQHLDDLCIAFTVGKQTEDVSDLDLLVSTDIYPGCHKGTINIKKAALSKKSQLGTNSWRKNFFLLSVENSSEFFSTAEAQLPTLPGVKCGLFSRAIYAFTEEGYEDAAQFEAQSKQSVGTLLYILNSAHTGGVITVIRKGVSKSVTQPGEHIMYTHDHSRSVSTVTSGALVYAMFDIRTGRGMEEDWVEEFRPKLVPFFTFPTRGELLEAVQSELSVANTSAGVVLCLSTLYPIVEFDPTGPYLETDPDVLTGRDAVLYEYMKTAFDITLVTVYVRRNKFDAFGCVLVPVPTVDTARTKIIAPFQGFRESFSVYNPKVHDKEGFATMYTALYIKNNEA